MAILRRSVKEFIFVIFGSALAGFGVGAFSMPAKIAGGGVNGIATILFHTFGFEPGISMLAMNIPSLFLV